MAIGWESVGIAIAGIITGVFGHRYVNFECKCGEGHSIRFGMNKDADNPETQENEYYPNFRVEEMQQMYINRLETLLQAQSPGTIPLNISTLRLEEIFPAMTKQPNTPVFSLQATPLGLQATPLGLQATPLGLHATPLGLQATPSSLQATPLGLQATPSSPQTTPLQSPRLSVGSHSSTNDKQE
jgi:hypothetical protein